MFNRRHLLAGAASAAVSFGLSLPAARAANTPTKPAGPMPPLEAYANLPFVDHIALSPDGSKIAIVSQTGDNKVLMVLSVADLKPNNLPLGPIKVRDLLWGDNDHVVIDHSSTERLAEFNMIRHEIDQAVIVDIRNGQTRTLFTDIPEFDNVVMGDVQRIKVDGEYRVTASNYKMDGDYNRALYSFSMDSNSGHMINLGNAYTEGWMMRPDGFPVACAQYGEHRDEWKLSLNAGSPDKGNNFKEVYRVQAQLDLPDLAGLGHDGQSALLYLRDGKGGGQFHEISADGTFSAPLDEGGADLSHSPLFHPVTRNLAGWAHYGDWVSYSWNDATLDQMTKGMTQMLGDGYRFRFEGFAEDPRLMIIYGEGPGDAGSHYFLDFTTGEVVPLTPDYPDLPVGWLADKTSIGYKAADGLDIQAYLTLPPLHAAKNLPLIVLPHGGPELRDDIGFDWKAQLLASRGYAVLQPNFRGSEGFGAHFIAAGHGEWGRKMQTDLSDGVRFLAAQGMIDPKRVAIFGASYGGYAALAGATLDASVYNCAVAIAGISDVSAMVTYAADQSESGESYEVRYWKDFLGDPKGYDDISPAKQAARASCPVLLIHGTDDVIVPIDQSRRMESALKAAGKDVQLVTYKGQDHWETIGSARIEMMKTALDFLSQHNPADPLPA